MRRAVIGILCMLLGGGLAPPSFDGKGHDTARPFKTGSEQLEEEMDNAKAAAVLRPGEDLDVRVGHLIDQLMLDDQQQAQTATLALVELGPRAIPAIIGRMDDRRALKIRHIYFYNKFPGAFEGIRHYGPERVVDCLAAVLNDITSKSSGAFIYNGGTDAERDAEVAYWRTYLLRQGQSRTGSNKALPMPRVPSKVMPRP